MTSASRLHPQGRLLALCLLSLLLHLLVLAWLAPGVTPPPSERGGGMPVISVRLGPAAAQPAVHADAAAAGLSGASGAALAPARAVTASAAPLPTRASTPTPAPTRAPEGVAATVDASAAAPSMATFANGSAAAGADEDDTLAPGRYRVRAPPPATLAYAVSRSLPGQPAAAAGEASLVWRSDDERYSLRLDGVPDQDGGAAARHSVTSEGGFNDAGLAPGSAATQHEGAAPIVTLFDRLRGRIGFGDGQGDAELLQGGQDQASLLLQLAGMGEAQPLQMHGTIELQVGGAGAAHIMRLEVTGEEQVATPLGPMTALHLVQKVRPGRARLEIWLAPALHWLPVQLRDSWPDGSVATRLLTRVEAPARAN